MWTRAELKSRAKAVLRHNYWRAFFMSLILLIAGASYSNMDSSNKHNNRHNTSIPYNQVMTNTGTSHTEVIGTYVYRIEPEIASNNNIVNRFTSLPVSFLPSLLSFLSGILKFGIVIAVIVFFLFKLLFGYGLQIGGRRYFINATSNPRSDFNCLSMAFKDGNFSNVIVTMFLRDLYTFLWSLLFVIPGVVKDLSYSMVPYILADNPKISGGRALQLSANMTKGHKWKIFVLRLSFLGWYILGSIAFMVGVAFVFPYENATFAELYVSLRGNAINENLTSCEELNIV